MSEKKKVEKFTHIINQQKETWIPLTDINPNGYNQNKMNLDRYESLKYSMESIGQVYPIIVRPNPDIKEKYIIIDGEHRWKSLTENKQEKAVCKVVNFTEAEARLFTIHINKTRGRTSELGERQIIEPIRGKLDYLDVSKLSLLPPLSAPVSPGFLSEGTNQTPPPVMDFSNSAPVDISIPKSPEKSETKELESRIGTEYEKTTASQNTVAIPLFFPESVYKHIMELTMKIKDKYKLSSREEAFEMLVRIGEEGERHREENNKLKEKIEKIEKENEEKRINRENKKQERIVTALEKQKQKELKKELKKEQGKKDAKKKNSKKQKVS